MDPVFLDEDLVGGAQLEGIEGIKSRFSLECFGWGEGVIWGSTMGIEVISRPST